jgi:hypothetical protein
MHVKELFLFGFVSTVISVWKSLNYAANMWMAEVITAGAMRNKIQNFTSGQESRVHHSGGPGNHFCPTCNRRRNLW